LRSIVRKEVTNFSFKADVGDEAGQRVRLETWHITGVGIPIGIAFIGVEEQNNVMPLGDYRVNVFVLEKGQEAIYLIHVKKVWLSCLLELVEMLLS
jgi:hypothetical protein